MEAQNRNRWPYPPTGDESIRGSVSRGHTFIQFMCGSLSSSNHANDDNMFLYYGNWGTDDPRVHLVGIFTQGANCISKVKILNVSANLTPSFFLSSPMS